MNRTIIIAEAGVNHNGDIVTAKKLIDVASYAGVDYVKFQTFKAETIVSREAQQASYQIENTGQRTSQFEMLKSLELSDSDHRILINHCQRKGIRFFSTAFDTAGLDYLFSLGFDLFKVPSGEITNYPYLRKLADFGKPVILSTGMANLKEIHEALDVLTSKKLDKKDITVLHCNTEYPTPMEDVNLKAMQTVGRECGVKVGYSDHTLGIEVPIAAVALGAQVIEKHFTLDRGLPGPDHKASLEPGELKAMVTAIRNIESAISGNGIKRPSRSEKKNIAIARKSIHLRKGIAEGEVIREDHLIPLRPGDGLSAMKWNEIIGKTAKRSLAAFHKLTEEDII